jgi:SAM-dependent methyltransferase
MRLLTGAWLARAVQVAAVVGVPDALADGPLPIDELASRTGTLPDPLFRVLRALATIGVVAEVDGGTGSVTAGTDEAPTPRFRLGELGTCLRSDVPGSLRPFAVMMGADPAWRSWGAMEHTVRTGETAFDSVFGSPLFDYYAAHPDAAAVGAAGLTSRSAAEDDAVLDAHDLSGARRIVDVGGGEGSLLRAALRRHPAATGVLLEMPHVIEFARRAIDGAQEASRAEFVAGDFFAEVPPGGDVYVLKKVLHDWPDEPAAVILRSVRDALAEGARVLLVEHVVPPGDQPSFAKLLDLLMLVYAGGRERTEDEFRRLLAAAGLVLSRVTPTAAAVSVLEAVRA